MEPKSIKNRTIMVSKTRSNVQWVLNNSWIDFGPVLVSKSSIFILFMLFIGSLDHNLRAQITLHKAPKGPEVLTGTDGESIVPDIGGRGDSPYLKASPTFNL